MKQNVFCKTFQIAPVFLKVPCKRLGFLEVSNSVEPPLISLYCVRKMGHRDSNFENKIYK